MAVYPEAVMILRFSIQYTSIALLYYDYALTWTREVEYFWRRRFSFSTALYIACRYAMVSNILYTLALAEKLSSMRVCRPSFLFLFVDLIYWSLNCDSGYQICAILSVIGRAAILIVWGARTYAIFNRSKVILVLFGSLGLFIMVLASMYVPFIACNGSRGNPPKVTDLLNALTVAYEVLSAVLSTMQSCWVLGAGGSWRSQRRGLMYLLLEQGLLYFFFISAFSVAALVLQYEGTPDSFTRRLLNALTIPLSGLMTARFLIHLREWEHLSRNGSGPSLLTVNNFPLEFRFPDRVATHWTAESRINDDDSYAARREEITGSEDDIGAVALRTSTCVTASNVEIRDL